MIPLPNMFSTLYRPGSTPRELIKRRIKTYQFLEEVAAGGHATVYRVFDSRTNQVLALKVLHPHLSKDPVYLARFEREATLASSIVHPNVVRIYEVGKEGEANFIAMEFLPLTLEHLLKSGAPLATERAVDIARQVASGLEAARACGVIHRDIKPQNILLDARGHAQITDFGIARTLDVSTMTRAGLVMGTPQYMAPEQAKGTPPDIRADIYSAGVLFYQMLAGRLPFKGATPWEIIRQHVEEEPEPLGVEAPAEVEKIVRRCLRKEPDERFQTPKELADALAAVQGVLRKPAPDDLALAMREAAATPFVPTGPATLPLPERRRARALTRNQLRWLALVGASVAAVAVIVPTAGLWPDLFGHSPVVAVPTATAIAATTPAPTVVRTPGPTQVVTPGPTTISLTPTPRLDFIGTTKNVLPLGTGQAGSVGLSADEAKTTGVLSVDITAANPIPASQLTVSKWLLSPVTALPPGKVFSYLELASSSMSQNSIAKLAILVQVPKTWLSAEDVPTYGMSLYAYDGGQWSKLPTVSAGTNGDNVIYQADAARLSYFAVVGVPEGQVTPPTPHNFDALRLQQTVLGATDSAVFQVASSPWKLRFRTNWSGDMTVTARTAKGVIPLVDQPVLAGLEYETYIYGRSGIMSLYAAGAPAGGEWNIAVTDNPTFLSTSFASGTALSYTGTSRANTPEFDVTSSPWLLRYETNWTGPLTMSVVGPNGTVQVATGEVTAGISYETYVYGVIGKVYLAARDAPSGGRWAVRATGNPTIPNNPTGILTYTGTGRINTPPFTLDTSPWRLVYIATWTGHLTLVSQTKDRPKVVVDRDVDAGVIYESQVHDVTGPMHLAMVDAPSDRAWSVSVWRTDSP